MTPTQEKFETEATQVLAPASVRKNPELLRELPRLTEFEERNISSSRRPRERQSTNFFHKQEVKKVIDTLRSDQQSIVLEGEIGAGKSTTILEIADDLDKKDVPYAFINPKKWSMGIQRQNIIAEEDFNETIDKLKIYSDKTTEPLVVLMDSGDYLYESFTYENLETISKKAEISDKNSKYAQLHRHEERIIKLMEILSKPQFKVVTTRHSDWPEDSIQPELYAKWRELFPESSTIQVRNEIELNRKVDFLLDSGKIKMDPEKPENKAMLTNLFESIRNSESYNKDEGIGAEQIDQYFKGMLMHLVENMDTLTLKRLNQENIDQYFIELGNDPNNWLEIVNKYKSLLDPKK